MYFHTIIYLHKFYKTDEKKLIQKLVNNSLEIQIECLKKNLNISPVEI